MTQKQLAAKTGINGKLISAYENDKVQPRPQNWRLLLEALDGTWAEAYLAAPSCDPEGAPEILAHPEALADEWSELCRHVTRLVGSPDATILVGWREANGDLVAIADTPGDGRLLTIRTRALPTTLDDLRSVRTVVDCLEEQIQSRAV